MRFPIATALLLLVVAASASAAHAGGDLAVVNGTVADYDGRPLPDAAVTLTGTGVRPMTIKTNTDGSYRFWGVRPKPGYSITASHPRYRTVVYDGLDIDISQRRVVRFRLKTPEQREAVLLLSKDPFPYEALAEAFSEGLGVPTRRIDLDQEPDPAEAVRRVAAEKPNVILSAGLLAGRLVRSEVHDIPSILTLIDDPRRYDLITPNNCFLSTNPDAKAVIERVADLLPAVRRIGLIYDAEKSELVARDLADAARARGLAVELRPCYVPSQVGRMLEQMNGTIDALVVPYDRLSVTPGALDAMIGWAHRQRMPLVAPQADWVEGGALLSFGVPPARLGEQARAMARRLLDQTEHPADLGLQVAAHPILAVNRATASDLGLTLPIEP
ncbi:MAG TPA: ABC transporter substrate binding protein [Dongiaceae bacterium]|nr:ABC transporter substrate binding protein [Dongiaceae bacterium]